MKKLSCVMSLMLILNLLLLCSCGNSAESILDQNNESNILYDEIYSLYYLFKQNVDTLQNEMPYDNISDYEQQLQDDADEINWIISAMLDKINQFPDNTIFSASEKEEIEKHIIDIANIINEEIASLYKGNSSTTLAKKFNQSYIATVTTMIGYSINILDISLSDKLPSRNLLSKEILKADETYKKNAYIIISKPMASKFDSIKIGDLVSYGNYEQDGTADNGVESIDWIVLEKQSDRMLLISNFALDCKLYDSTHWWDMSWEICTLRNWLNNDFFNSSFNSEDKNEILLYTTESGLSDNVFILNKEEVEQYLTDELKMCRATKYALNNGAYSAYNNNCFWWIRNSGGENDSVPYIDYNGDYATDGNAIRNSNYAVRPAIWITSNANVKVRPSIDEMIDLILTHYKESGLFSSNGNYVIYNNEVIEKTNKRTFVIRYQVSDEEVQEYLDRGSFPPANRYVTSVVVDMVTGNVSDEIYQSHKWNMW